MDWMSLDTIGKVLIPALTFFLGLGVAIWTKALDKRRSDIKEHVTAVVRLVNAWYNQLHQLSVETAIDRTSLEVRKSILAYVNSRLILPELLLHVEFLRERSLEPALLKAVDEFFALVTLDRSPAYNDGPAHNERLVDAEEVKRSTEMRRTISLACVLGSVDGLLGDPVSVELSERVEKVDIKIQEIARLAAQSVATKA